MIIPAMAHPNATSKFFVTQKVAIKIAPKQEKLPATVFPLVKGILICPHSLPIKLAKPSPKAKDKIPTVAGMGGNRAAVNKIPKTKVTGPKTNLFSSRFLAATDVIAEINGTSTPLYRKDSATEYTIRERRSKIMVGTYQRLRNKGTRAAHICIAFLNNSFCMAFIL